MVTRLENVLMQDTAHTSTTQTAPLGEAKKKKKTIPQIETNPFICKSNKHGTQYLTTVLNSYE